MNEMKTERRFGGRGYRMEAFDNPTQARTIEHIKYLMTLRAILEVGRASAKHRELDLIIAQQVLRLAANPTAASERHADKAAFLRECLVMGSCPLNPSAKVMIQAALTTEEALRLARAAHH